MCSVFVQKTPKVEGIQFDGDNSDEIIEFVGGEDYGKVVGDSLVLSLQGKDPRSQKVTVNRGQFVIKTATATTVVNEGDFVANFANEDGTPIGGIPPIEEPEPVPEEELVYQPGFRPLTDEEKKAAAKKSEKKEAEPTFAFGKK